MTSRSDGSSEPWIADGVCSMVNMISSGRDLTRPRGGGGYDVMRIAGGGQRVSARSIAASIGWSVGLIALGCANATVGTCPKEREGIRGGNHSGEAEEDQQHGLTRFTVGHPETE